MLFLSCCLVDCNLYLILIMSCNPACTVGLMIFILVVSAGSLIDPLPIDCCSITDCMCVCLYAKMLYTNFIITCFLCSDFNVCSSLFNCSFSALESFNYYFSIIMHELCQLLTLVVNFVIWSFIIALLSVHSFNSASYITYP